MAHGLGKALQEEPAILVVDIGGGTCDISLLQSFEGILEVVGYDGDSTLGGVDLDENIVKQWISSNKLPASACYCALLPCCSPCAGTCPYPQIALRHGDCLAQP
jgi:Hsp70 protein